MSRPSRGQRSSSSPCRASSPAVAAELAPVIDGAVVVDATNASNETYSDLALNATNGWAWQSAWQLVGPTA